MEKGIMKSISGVLIAVVLMIFAGILSNCDNSDGGEEGPASLTGKYKFKKAVLTSEVIIEDQAVGSDATIVLAVGTDVTDMVVGGLVGSITCGSSTNAAIDLRTNKELWAFCNTENVDPVRGGTWSENATRTILTLNLAPPLVPTSFQLIQTNVTVSGNELSGAVTSIPMTGVLVEAGIPDELIPAGFVFPAVVVIDINLDYTKI